MTEPPGRHDAVPIRLPNIEPIPKRVVLADDFTSIKLNEKEERDFLSIRAAIASGRPLNAFYRASKTYDRLLRDHAVLHLHLGGKGSNAILYVVQYPEHVLFVCISTHRHLETTPPGSQLPARGRREFEAKIKAEKKAWDEKLLHSKAKLFKKDQKIE